MEQLAQFHKNIKTLLTDTGNGIVTVTHSGLAMVGLAVSVCVVVLVLRPDYLAQGEAYVFNWLRERHVSLWWMPENVVDRVTAADLSARGQKRYVKPVHHQRSGFQAIRRIRGQRELPGPHTGR